MPNPNFSPTPLRQLSADRINQHRLPTTPSTPTTQLSPDRIKSHILSESPSLTDFSDSRTPRQSFDVQSKVAFLNNLSQSPSPTRQSGGTSHAGLQRALLGREEAEGALRKTNTQLAEADVRQRKISERVETLMDELQSVKERQLHERQVFEKEVRKARKDAFRASSALVKLQEDLKDSRTEARLFKTEAQHERFEKEKSKQESFERAYTLAGLLEEVGTMREKMKNMEAARVTELLEHESQEMQREEDERLLVEKKARDEGEQVALPKAAQLDESSQELEETAIRQNRFRRSRSAGEISPSIAQQSPIVATVAQSEDADDVLKNSESTRLRDKLDTLKAELSWEKQLRADSEGLVHLLRMECQFQMCSCRIAERNGTRFVHDKVYDEVVKHTPQVSERGKESPKPLMKKKHEAPKPSRARKAEAILAPAGPRNQRQQKDDMFHISRTERPLKGPRTCPPSSRSPTKELPPTKKKEPQRPRTASPPSRVTTHDESAQAEPLPMGNLSLLSFKNTSSPAVVDAEDMTYQSPLRTMTRPKSACATMREATTSPPARSPSASPYPLAPGFKTPQRPGLRVVHSHNTTTTLVPLRADDDVFSPAPGTPGTPVSREAALAQIRARRDRARSVAMSGSRGAPGSARRGLVGGLRDISAPSRF